MLIFDESIKVNSSRSYMMASSSPSGEIIDCVDIYKQPALDHPLLRNHKIQIEPDFDVSDTPESSYEPSQDWHVNGQCPKGTVPIIRIQKSDILRASSLESFVRKDPSYRLPHGNIQKDSIAGHEYAIVRLNYNDKFYGGKADINVWKPKVKSTDMSLAQIWIQSQATGELNTIEAGIMVQRYLFRDDEPRLFIYWTGDGYKKTGCYNVRCPGFVQTNNAIGIGAKITPISSYGGDQYIITLKIEKAQDTGDWWLFYHDQKVGYWPNSLIPGLKEYADAVHWGGEIYNRNYQWGSTTTEMGSGHFPEEGLRKAAYFRNFQFADAERMYWAPDDYELIATKPECYDCRMNGTDFFYYGGPGKSNYCTK